MHRVCPARAVDIQSTSLLPTAQWTLALSKVPQRQGFWQPRYWPTWLMLGTLWLCTRLPYRLQIHLGAGLGRVLYHISRHRRFVTETNIRLCFPELNEQARRARVRAVFRNNGIGILETAMAWWMPESGLPPKLELKGREYLDQALEQGRGVILLGAHFSSLDLGGLLFARFYKVSGMYRPHNNPLMDRVIRRGRERFFERAIERSDIRSVIRTLRQNGIVWYAPDQDMGIKNAVYAPFFGIPAATITATTRMVKLNDSPILMLAQHRLPDDSGYELELYPALENFPGKTPEEDAQRVNAAIEQAVRKDPSQYMWVHRRFKTHPQGKNFLYQKR